MDARTHSRHRISAPVELHCSAKNCHLPGRIRDISTGGLFVIAPARVQIGWPFDICMNFPGWKNEQRINATVQRISNQGFALQFPLNTDTRQLLDDILLPKWDGNNVYEGLIIFAARERVVDFSEWLRLTSLVCNEYRQCARALSRQKEHMAWRDL